MRRREGYISPDPIIKVRGEGYISPDTIIKMKKGRLHLTGFHDQCEKDHRYRLRIV